MKLKDNLYTISSCEPTTKGADFHVCLDAECAIYKAHFPEHPVTPGVCVVEIAHELLEEHMRCPLSVTMVKNVKFLAIISPLEIQAVTYKLNINEEDGGVVKLQTSVVAGEKVYAKLSLICQK